MIILSKIMATLLMYSQEAIPLPSKIVMAVEA